MFKKVRALFDERRPFAIAQLLLLLVLVSITRSPPLTSLFELLLVGLFAFSKPLRNAFLDTLRDLRVVLALGFFAWIGLTMFWSPVEWDLRLDKWWSWRKVLYFPMAMAVFQPVRSKILPIYTLVLVAAIYVTLSWGAYWNIWELWAPAEALIRNDATQGVFFSFAAFLATYLVVINKFNFSTNVALIITISSLISNQIFVLPGRSGYLTLLVLSMCLVFYLVPRYKLFLSCLAGVFVVGILVASPQSGSRINQAIDESLTAYDDNSEFSSLGVRRVFWSNGLEMFFERPLIGTGADGLKYFYTSHVSEEVGWRSIPTDDLHQQYLNIAVEFGLIGLILFSLFILSMLVRPWRNEDYIFVGSALALSFLANGFANGHFNGFTEGRLIWIFWGAMLAGTTFQSHFKQRFMK